MTLTRPENTPDKLESFAGEPVVLEVEVSRLGAEVVWRMNGKEVEESSNVAISEDGLTRRLTVHCPAPEDSGRYTCDACDDTMDFEVKVSGDEAMSALDMPRVAECNYFIFLNHHHVTML